MPLYLDRHDVPGATAEDVAQAHIRDLEVQDSYGVRYVTYWLDTQRGSAFCLAEAPDHTAAVACHEEAHGLIPSQVIEVDGTAVQAFLGRIYEPAQGEAWAATAFRIILFSDIADSTGLTQRLGDTGAMVLVRAHDAAVRGALEAHDGSEVKHTGDGIMATFTSVVRGLECAVDVQSRIGEQNRQAPEPVRVRIGLSAGEPVTEHDDLFGAAVQLAARVCAAAEPGCVLVPSVVRDLALGKGFTFEARGEVELKGFDEPVRLFQLCCE